MMYVCGYTSHVFQDTLFILHVFGHLQYTKLDYLEMISTKNFYLIILDKGS